MRKFMVSVLLMLFGCSHNLLTSNKKPVVRQAGFSTAACAWINEWKVENKIGCWCMIPPIQSKDGGWVMLFSNVPDSFCDENVSQEELYKMFPQ